MITAEKARELFKVNKELRKLKRKINWIIKYEARSGKLSYRSFITPKSMECSKQIINYYENLNYKVTLNIVNDFNELTISWEK